MTPAERCFHCALPIPEHCVLAVDVDGDLRPVCCPGCRAVAELIVTSGLANYYAMRDAPEPGVGRPEPGEDEWQVFNRGDMLSAFGVRDGDTVTATLYVAGMYCSACSWLIETTLGGIGGVAGVDVNPITHRVQVRFDADAIGLGDILSTLARLGYRPQPLKPESAVRPELAEQRTALKRLLVASLGMMQVMMFAVALYAGEFQGIDAKMQRFLRLVSFLVTTPVVFYSARPFFQAAIRGVRARRPGMDLPVSIAIGSAYAASVYATLTDAEAVWFDSVTMFVFFLTLGRFLEMRARHRSIDRTLALATVLPDTAIRLAPQGQAVVPVSRLVAGDRVLVRPGDAIPADGVVDSGSTRVDESVLTGESVPQKRAPGDSLIAGSVNLDDAVEMSVRATGVDTTLGAISRLSERARYARPAIVRIADRVASYIVVAILVVATIVAVVWSQFDASRAFVVTLSVLVVTCPCALALAMPAAFAAAGSRLAELKLLVTNGDAIEALSRVTHVVFDKTGTLTRGQPVIVAVTTHDARFDEAHCRAIASALEAGSTHPLAAAFALPSVAAAEDCRTIPGSGVTGTVDGIEWRLGRPEFVAPGRPVPNGERTIVWLGSGGALAAEFVVEDGLRSDATVAVDRLREMGVTIALASGDAEEPVGSAAAALGIDDAHHGLSPAEKLDLIRRRQQAGDVVAMVGDGINDAPVLAGADASIAPAHAAELAQISADVVMLGDALLPVATSIRMARRTMRIVRQNLAWAIVYNALALPLAAAGFVPPWLAAIGMSASSLIVVLNALRLARFA